MIITLCGSARFEAWFKVWNEALTLAGHCVFSLSVYPSDKPEKSWYTEDEKIQLDWVHKQKIHASEAILLLNPFAYIGESTLGEIAYARQFSKRIYALESWGQGYGIDMSHYKAHRDHARSFDVVDFRSPIGTTGFDGMHHPWDLLGPASRRRWELVKLVKSLDAVIEPTAGTLS